MRRKIPSKVWLPDRGFFCLIGVFFSQRIYCCFWQKKIKNIYVFLFVFSFFFFFFVKNNSKSFEKKKTLSGKKNPYQATRPYRKNANCLIRTCVTVSQRKKKRMSVGVYAVRSINVNHSKTDPSSPHNYFGRNYKSRGLASPPFLKKI